MAASLASLLLLSSPALCKQASLSRASFISAYLDSLLCLSPSALRKQADASSSSVVAASLASLICLSCESFCNQEDASSPFRIFSLNPCLLYQVFSSLIFNLDSPGWRGLEGGCAIWFEWLWLLLICNCNPRLWLLLIRNCNPIHLTLTHVKYSSKRRVPQEKNSSKQIFIIAYILVITYTLVLTYTLELAYYSL